MKIFIALFSVVITCLMCGCFSTPKVVTTKAWENHYMTTNSFHTGTINITIDKDESIWVLSNKTLARLLGE